MRVRMLSNHFIQRWQQRVGGMPTLGQVNRIIDEAYLIRSTRNIFVPGRDGVLRPERQLSEYWNHERGMIVRVDATRKLAVTVITPE